jgi:serine/threonine protein kinase
MLLFLRCIGEAVAAKGLRALVGLVPMGEQVVDIAGDAIERYRHLRLEAQIPQAIEEVVQAAAEDVRREARQIAEEVLAGRPAEEVARLGEYLNQVPAVARQSLKRPDDLGGKTVPAQMNLHDPAQLANLLPRRLPRFQPGQPVPHAPQWRFVELLGAGGFGEVWLAQHSFLDQQRAFKFCLDEKVRIRLIRYEGEVVQQVMRASQGTSDDEHGIVPLLDAHLEGDTPWLAYEYISGGDLSAIVRKLAGLSPKNRGEQSLIYLIALVKVISKFHIIPQPIIHRDLKPANILLKKHDKKLLLRVTDFGISHVEADRGIRQESISTPQMTLGATYRGAFTPLYASPQQKRGMKPDVRDDVYALGIIGWQLLLGDLSAERPAGKWRKRLAECQLSDAVLDLLESCWDDDPNERPANAAVLAERLQACYTSSTKVPPAKDARAAPAQDARPAPAQDARAARVQEQFRDYVRYGNLGNGTKPWLEKNQSSVTEWQESANRGLSEAMVLLADCYQEGVSVPQDYAEAMKWYRKAADAGNAAAMKNIGWLYANGHGVSQDDAEAMKWYRKAADAGDTWAMIWIGWLYANGQGVSQDDAEAMEWYRHAADEGDTDAMTTIGRMYQEGVGVQRDKVEARRWYQLAMEHGSEEAKRYLKKRS